MDETNAPRDEEKNESLLELSSSAVQLVADPEHLIGTTIAGRFVVESHLGSCDGREIYAGKQAALDRPVTIKLVREATDGELCRRFLREGRLLAKLDHPGIVTVIDVGEHDGRPYVVTEAPKGDTLEAILEVRGRIDWRAAHDLLISIAEAVGCAHSAGLVHRDLHPRNIVVGADGLPRITDFVFAYETAPFDDEATTQMLTARGAVVGALEWVAPEQLMGFPVDTRADLYTLGVLAYRMVAGGLPHQASRAAELLSLQAGGAVSLMAAADLPEAARPFAELVDRLLSHEADRRGFKTATELAKALRIARTAPSPKPRSDSATQPALAGIDPFRERAGELARALVLRAKPIVARAKALPRRAQLGIAAGLVLSIASFAAIASSDEQAIEAQPVSAAPAAPPIDPAQIALREDAREAARHRDIPRALHGYRSLAEAAPDAFEAEDFENVVSYLARPNSNTGVAEKILIATAPKSVPPLRSVFEDDRSGRYLQRRAGEVLEKLGEPVDLVPLWIATLKSEECGARKLAVRRLVKSQDRRAVAPLSALGRGMSCGAQEARAGLRRLQTSG